MKSLLSGILLTLVVLFLFFTSACHSIHEGKSPPKAVKGILDLTQWDFEKDGHVYLNGEYEFYWKEHVSPSDFSNPSHQSPTFVNVPGF
jgi:hypothetical protein